MRQSLNFCLDSLNKLQGESNYGRCLNGYRTIVSRLANDKLITLKSLQRELKGDSKNNLPVHTHSIYLKNKINNLKILLSDYIHWYKINKKNNIYTVQITSGLLSEVLNLLTQYQGVFTTDQEIRLLVSGTLHINEDMEKKNYSGMNIVLITYRQQLSKRSPFLIKTDGAAAVAHFSLVPDGGVGHDSTGKGLKGADGLDGLPGKNAGNVYVVASRLVEMKVSAHGGNSGDAQIGGAGGPGRDGDDGVDGNRS